MEKYLLISKKFGLKKRGAYLSALFFSKKFDSYIDCIEQSDVTSYIEHSVKYKRIIFLTQEPKLYSKQIHFITSNKLNAIQFIRPEHISLYNNTTSNGFYTYITNRFKYYIPMIYSNVHQNKIYTDDILNIGFYYRIGFAHDSFEWFKKFIRDTKYKINLSILGDRFHLESSNIQNIYHYTDRLAFFNSISHYVYPKSSYKVDPFPHSLLEAAHNNIQLIIPTNTTRNFKDRYWWYSGCLFISYEIKPSYISR